MSKENISAVKSFVDSKLFSKEKLLVGLQLFLLGSLPFILIDGLISYLQFPYAQEISYGFFPIQILVFSMAAIAIAKRKFNQKTLSSFWWSLNWRVFVLILGIVILAAVVTGIVILAFGIQYNFEGLKDLSKIEEIKLQFRNYLYILLSFPISVVINASAFSNALMISHQKLRNNG